MQARTVAVAALALGALAAPATAQIIATSIPKSISGGEEGRWAFHVMGSPFAKWRINSYTQEPIGSDSPILQQSTTTNSASKFILAAEAAFKAGSDTTVGIGGWYNDLGRADVDFFQLNLDPKVATLLFAGVAPFDVRVSEVHGNIFYKALGVQAGLVRTKFRQRGLRAGTTEVFFDENGDLQTETRTEDEFFDSDPETFNNWDAFLVYKKGSSTGRSTSWGFSLGSGIYRDNEVKSTNFTGFVTATVGLYKGLGLDASFWYVGAQKKTAARQEFESLLEKTVKPDMSRFTAGVSYTFSR
jgi:hypothetical protein